MLDIHILTCMYNYYYCCSTTAVSGTVLANCLDMKNEHASTMSCSISRDFLFSRKSVIERSSRCCCYLCLGPRELSPRRTHVLPRRRIRLFLEHVDHDAKRYERAKNSTQSLSWWRVTCPTCLNNSSQPFGKILLLLHRSIQYIYNTTDYTFCSIFGRVKPAVQLTVGKVIYAIISPPDRSTLLIL